MPQSFFPAIVSHDITNYWRCSRSQWPIQGIG